MGVIQNQLQKQSELLLNADDLDAMWVCLRENCVIDDATGAEKVIFFSHTWILFENCTAGEAPAVVWYIYNNNNNNNNDNNNIAFFPKQVGVG